ncbi:translation initiation factor IF-3 [Spiroplasma sabaudiense Ar-1343]|uniref:Translation initiation factor IF-3 n=1 Tax=Spiroplasma sabaudiense Ar-1343 TaxID=1276257 RepID=W6ABK2_9MOLU|nr:translation initiation factor IF-3 [Spiroplasma sabaudiense]AHI54200.1 translation initiation factor IF-3 [Spiroplasma sabaudiense Ar-1343]
MAEIKRETKSEFVNREIRAKMILVIDNDGNKIGPISKMDALKMAEDRDLDLLQVGQQDNNTAIAKILDYGKFKYEQKRKVKENKKNQTKTENKEIRLTVGIGQHDLETKAKKAREFLSNGDRVKVSLKFKGREIVHQEFGQKTLEAFLKIIEDVCKVEKEPKLTSRFLDVYVVPKKG